MAEEDIEFITFDGDASTKSDYRDEIINKYIQAGIDGLTKITDFTIGSEAYHLADVMASFIPKIEFNNVLLPTFGLPTILTKPHFILNHLLQMDMDITLLLYILYNLLLLHSILLLHLYQIILK